MPTYKKVIIAILVVYVVLNPSEIWAVLAGAAVGVILLSFLELLPIPKHYPVEDKDANTK